MSETKPLKYIYSATFLARCAANEARRRQRAHDMMQRMVRDYRRGSSRTFMWPVGGFIEKVKP